MKRQYSLIRVTTWMMYPMLFIITLAVFLADCSGNEPQRNIQPEKDSGRRDFKMAGIPQGIEEPHQRADYLVRHYWDNFNFSDTAYIHMPQVSEQAFVNYLNILPHTNEQQAYSSITSMLARAVREDSTGKVYSYFLSLYRKYLYDPNSPVRDDELYIPVTAYILEDRISDEARKTRAGFDMEMMLKNRKGDTASDIIYTLADGSIGSLHNLSRDYTLLYFYNPDCTACKETTAYLKASPVINQLLESQRIDLLVIYPDEDISLWKEYIPQIPALWINGYDKEQVVRNEQLYDLKAIPSLYLIDSRKCVVIKDKSVTTMEEYLSNLLSDNK